MKITAEIRPLAMPSESLFDALATAMRTSVSFAKALWIRRAQQLRIRRSGEYLRGIEVAEPMIVNESRSDTHLQMTLVLTNRAPHAGIVENGHGAFHLPSKINWSGPRVRHGKNGPYLRIPFGHGAFQDYGERTSSGMTMATMKTMMPEEVYDKAKRLSFTEFGKRSSVPPSRRRLTDNRSGFVAYEQGLVLHRRTSAQLVGQDAKGQDLINPAWQTSRFQGLMKVGRKGHAKYLTIRTITPRSAGWNIPAQIGHGVARQVSRAMSSGPGGERYRQLLVESIRRSLNLRRDIGVGGGP